MAFPASVAVTGLEICRDALAAAALGLTPAVNLFMADEPDSTVDVPGCTVLLTEFDGVPALTMGTPIAVENQMVQVKVRGDAEDYTTPKDLAARIRYTLVAKGEHTTRSVRVLGITPVGGVLALGRDSRERPEFTVNVNVAWEPPYVY